jgi:hypothetical protein
LDLTNRLFQKQMIAPLREAAPVGGVSAEDNVVLTVSNSVEYSWTGNTGASQCALSPTGTGGARGDRMLQKMLKSGNYCNNGKSMPECRLKNSQKKDED